MARSLVAEDQAWLQTAHLLAAVDQLCVRMDHMSVGVGASCSPMGDTLESRALGPLQPVTGKVWGPREVRQVPVNRAGTSADRRNPSGSYRRQNLIGLDNDIPAYRLIVSRARLQLRSDYFDLPGRLDPQADE